MSKMKGKRISFCIFMILICTLLIIAFKMLNMDSRIYVIGEESIENFYSIQENSNLEDDFEDNRVIVTLKSTYSEINKVFDIQEFKTEKLLTCEDLSYE